MYLSNILGFCLVFGIFVLSVGASPRGEVPGLVAARIRAWRDPGLAGPGLCGGGDPCDVGTTKQLAINKYAYMYICIHHIYVYVILYLCCVVFYVLSYVTY